jgi:hypothetical protein
MLVSVFRKLNQQRQLQSPEQRERARAQAVPERHLPVLRRVSAAVALELLLAPFRLQKTHLNHCACKRSNPLLVRRAPPMAASYLSP